MKFKSDAYTSIEDCNGKFEDFYRKIKTISELFIYLTETETFDDRIILLIEAMALCVQNYKIKTRKSNKINPDGHRDFGVL